MDALPICIIPDFQQKDQPITYLHFHECLEIGYCHSGHGVFVVGDKVLPFQAGDLSFINHTEVHLARSAPGTSSKWTWIYLDPVRLCRAAGTNLRTLDPTPLAGPNFNNILCTQQHPSMNRIVLDMIHELQTHQHGRTELLHALTWQLMVLAQRLRPETNTTQLPTTYDRIVPALQYMADSYCEPVNIVRIARLCHMSTSHFRRVFLRTIRQSPREYWHAIRLRMAASLLKETSLSILEISLRVGFPTLSSFNRLFRQQFHTSPRQWRRGENEKNAAGTEFT